MFDSIKVLNGIYQEEKKLGKLKEIFINISTASKAFALAGYIFGLFHRDITKIFYLGTSNYILLDHLEGKNASIDRLKDEFLNHGLTKGPYAIEEIPLLPILNFNKNEMDFMLVLSSQGEFISIDDFKKKLPNEYQTYNRVKIRRILSSLEEKEFISILKSGRYQKILVNDNLINLVKILFF